LSLLLWQHAIANHPTTRPDALRGMKWELNSLVTTLSNSGALRPDQNDYGSYNKNLIPNLWLGMRLIFFWSLVLPLENTFVRFVRMTALNFYPGVVLRYNPAAAGSLSMTPIFINLLALLMFPRLSRRGTAGW